MTDDELEELTPAAQALCVLMADEIGPVGDFKVKDMDTLITIGRAMFWSEDFYKRARELAGEYEREVENYNGDDGS